MQSKQREEKRLRGEVAGLKREVWFFILNFYTGKYNWILILRDIIYSEYYSS